MAFDVTENPAWVPVPGWDDTTPADGSTMNLSLVALVSRDGYILSIAQGAQTAATAAQGTADTAVTNAASAQGTANTALATANAAQPGSATLTAFSGLSLATAGNVPYVSVAGVLSMAATTSFGRSLWSAAAATNARTTLGLGGSATLGVGTAAGTVAAGDDARFSTKGWRNMLVNCGLPINQVVFAGGALAAGVYGYDMWKAGTGGCNVTINATTGVFTHTSGPLQQIVEAPEQAWGLPLTISVEDPSGTVSVSVGGSTGSITAGAGRRGVTLTPSGSGNMTVQLTATGVTYSRPQLERGSFATNFDVRPAALEMELCQRHYEKSYALATAVGTATNIGRQAVGSAAALGATSITTIRFAVPKRGTPTVAVYGSTGGVSGQVTQDDSSSIAATTQNVSANAMEVVWTNGVARWGGFFHFVADARL